MQQWISAEHPSPALPAPAGDPAPADPLAFAPLTFKPVPRKYRFDGWTAERQRAFIAALAELGSVKAACQRINLATTGAYHLRRQPGADGFRAAWEAALASGVQRLADIAIDRAIEGTPVPVFYHGEQVGERRRYNDRLLMFIMKHHMPGRYGTAALPGGTKHPETIAREAAAGCPACKERAAADARKAAAHAEAAKQSRLEFAAEILRTYTLKVAAERRDRIAGNIVGADFYLRQLSFWELILEGCGNRADLIKLYTTREGLQPGDEVWVRAGPLSQTLDDIRREAWAAAGEPPRPPLDLRERYQWSGITGGSTVRERERARVEAQRQIAAAQAVWEACRSDETWARFKADSES
ncbi:hypothetical protein [Sphingomonas radiodurans]|uniref:hypothetical protein n=1 Tax=Sphingomonas radiodurans TaxID=2890321 RepID=UPI001E63E4FB|nr:hypothetical protein [Sphingomonas radiodurans]WBH16634.1 hypothetical protein LLW23_00430 [Sphingomonas radiodurans]